MEQQTFEGTWEEILLHTSELTGKRVKLTVLAHDTSDRPATENLDKLLKGRVGRVNFQPFLYYTTIVLQNRQECGH